MFYTKTTIKFKMFHHLQGLISGHQGRLSTEHSCQSFGGRTSTTINVGIRDRVWCFKLCTSRLHIIFRYYIYCPTFLFLYVPQFWGIRQFQKNYGSRHHLPTLNGCWQPPNNSWFLPFSSRSQWPTRSLDVQTPYSKARTLRKLWMGLH